MAVSSIYRLRRCFNRICRISFLAILLFAITSSVPSPYSVYLDNRLAEPWSAQKSVIVTAVSAETAVSALEAAGAEVQSSLWLIDAATANISYATFHSLQRQPGILSIVENSAVTTAVSPANSAANGPGANPENNRQLWGSDRRQVKNAFAFNDNLKVSPLALANDRVFVISEKGDGLILGPWGDVIAQLQLDDGPFVTHPATGSDGSIYLASKDEFVYALNPDGSIRWRFTDAEDIETSVTFYESPAQPEGTLYVVNKKGRLTALNGATGQIRWTFTFPEDSDHDISRPVTDSVGNVYVAYKDGYLISLSPDGKRNWMFANKDENKFLFAPVLGPDNRLYLTDDKKFVQALSPGGQLLYRHKFAHKATAVPLITANQQLIVPVKDQIHVINGDGSLPYTFASPQGGQFKSAPVLSPDQKTVYIALKEKWLFAVDLSTGQLNWQIPTNSDLIASPLVESNGDIHLVSKDGQYWVIDSTGTILYTHHLSDDVEVAPILLQSGLAAFFLTKSKFVEAVSLLPASWEKTGIYALPTENPAVWEFAAVNSIDVGADVLHDPLMQKSGPITGQGVTIAVVDSGVAIDDTAAGIDTSRVNNVFIGQADFVNEGNCPANGDLSGLEQRDNHCWASLASSYDPYGHGTHLAGIIWNHFTEAKTGVNLGIAPDAQILSVRVLNENGMGTYTDIIEGIQFVIENQKQLNVRVMNLSLSATASVPYFVDPLNRAVEAAWANGIVVVAAAGNSGPSAQSITVPGNDPYVITVGALHTNRTPGYWGDDTVPEWSATGPTLDGFIKPDVLAPGTDIVSFMFKDNRSSEAPFLMRTYPAYAEAPTLFRMNGTSTATAVTSGVVALMLEKDPALTPDQVKYRLMATAKTAVSANNEPTYSALQQGIGRIWAPGAVLANLPNQSANAGLNIHQDLAHPWQPEDSPDPQQNPDLAFHYQGPINILESDQQNALMFFVEGTQLGSRIILGVVDKDSLAWLSPEVIEDEALTFENGRAWSDYIWSGGTYAWSGGTYAWSGGTYVWSGGTYAWSGGTYAWSGGTYAWSGGTYAWSGGTYAWSGGLAPAPSVTGGILPPFATEASN